METIINNDLRESFQIYLSLFPSENHNFKLLQEQLDKDQSYTSSENYVGHITASGFLLDHKKRRILLGKQKELDMMLPPGGHMTQSDKTPLETAKREISEKTGIQIQMLELYEELPGQPLIPFDIDTHYIPAKTRDNEPGHFHHDFRYCFYVKSGSEDFEYQIELDHTLKWIDISQLFEITQFRRSINKIKELSLKNKPARFFSEIISKNLVNSDKPNSIIVTHLLQDRPILLSALASQTNLKGIIAKPRSIDTKVLEEVSSKYSILNFTKESLKEFDQFNNFIKSVNGKVVLLDIGGYFAPIINRLVSENENKILGVVEDTENGHQKYESIHNLSVPVISVARSYLKENEDSLVGHSIVFSVDSLLRDYNRLLMFMKCGVIGYGKIGFSIASYLQKYTIKPMVFDLIYSKRVKSINDGNESPDKVKLLESSDVIFCATGSKSLNIHDFRRLKNGCFIASVTSADDEFDFNFLESEYEVEHVNQFITKYTNTANYFYLLNSGNAVNFIHGAVVGDFIFLVQSEILSGINYLTENINLEPKIHELPNSYRENLSKVWLKHFTN